jgi:hypothetical protein
MTVKKKPRFVGGAIEKGQYEIKQQKKYTINKNEGSI